MLQKPPVIRLRNLKELQSSQKLKAENEEFVTPLKVKKPRKRATVTKDQTPANIPVAAPPVSATKRVSKSALKEPPPGQLRIDTFFKTSVKTFKIDRDNPPTPMFRKAATDIKVAKEKRKTACTKKKSPRKKGRKRLFPDDMSTSTEDGSASPLNVKYNKTILRANNNIAIECITLISDSDEEEGGGGEADIKVDKISNAEYTTARLSQRHIEEQPLSTRSRRIASKASSVKSPTSSRKENSRLMSSSKRITSGSSSTNSPMALDSDTSKPVIPSFSSSSSTKRRKPKACPPYKVIEGTTFAVDAFQYGCIEGVTHYFLTHFHADHYIGLTRKFAMPLYMSPITARLVRTFIPLDEQYIHEMELNSPQIVNNIEITALDANHCPGAVMLLFKFPDTGECILHTGDFRGWHGMESEPVFWNNDIATIYLDTTYISHKYEFCTQYESIVKAKDLMQKFKDKHADKRILYICGSYVIGKEKFWSALAEEFQLKVWTEDNRSKALKAMEDKELNKLLIDDPFMADMHVIAMGKISYLNLVEYFSKYEHQYDILLAIRPSGWEKDSRPQYRGKINIIGIEYSEHSSYGEMQRFVKFLKPLAVISTVPTGRDLMKTAKVPEKWYKYENLQSSSNYQPCIEQFLSKTPQRKTYIRHPNANIGGLDTFVSPLSQKHLSSVREINNNDPDTVKSIISSENEFEQPHTTNRKITIESAKKEEKLLLSQNSNKREQMKKASSKMRRKEDISNSQMRIKAEKLAPSQNSKNPSGNVPSTQKSTKRGVAVRQRTPTQIRNKPNIPDNNTSELVLSQCLKAGDSCSIFISKSNESQRHDHKTASSTGSSDYFVMQPLKNHKRKSSSSSANEVVPVSQKRNTRTENRKLNLPTSLPDPVEEDEPEFASDTGTNKKIHMVSIPSERLAVYKTEDSSVDAFLRDTPTTSQMAKMLLKYKCNPLLKSNTSSCASSVNEKVLASQSSEDFDKTPRRIRNNLEHLNGSENDIIPASQTSKDLENTSRPLRNKIRYSQHVQACLAKKDKQQRMNASQTSKDLENTSMPPLRNKIPDPHNFLDFFSQNDVIPASQTSKDLENTPRPIRNKRNKTMPLSLASSPSKKSKEIPSVVSSDGTSPDVLTQILKESQTIDFYNTSQLVGIIADTLAQQQPDKSLDHIPQDLLSDADDDWLN